MLKNIFIILALLTVITTAYTAGDITGKLTIDGIEREYILHLPADYGTAKLPLVMVFHGGGGNAEQVKEHTKFNKLADNEDFIVRCV